MAAFLLTLWQTQSEAFQRSVLHLVFPNEYTRHNGGLRIKTVVILCLFCLCLALLNFVHVCICKLKKATVIVPTQEVPINPMNLVINNQAYNKDLFDSFGIAAWYIVAATFCYLPIGIVNFLT